MKTTVKKIKGYSLTGTLVILGLVIMVIGTYYYLTNSNKINKPALVSTQKTEQAPIVIEPTVIDTSTIESTTNVSPVSTTQTTTAPSPEIVLPTLDNSDEMALASAQRILIQPKHTALLVNQEMIRNFVVFIDNFSRGQLVSSFAPFTKPNEQFSVIEQEQQLYLDTESYNRYNIYTDIVASINVKLAINQYHKLMPLLNEAYQELGYTEDEFDSQLVQAIELVLNAPVIREPIALIAPSVMYKFANPELEALPAAQKLLIRMGPDNTMKLKEKLQQFEDALYQGK